MQLGQMGLSKAVNSGSSVHPELRLMYEVSPDRLRQARDITEWISEEFFNPGFKGASRFSDFGILPYLPSGYCPLKQTSRTVTAGRRAILCPFKAQHQQPRLDPAKLLPIGDWRSQLRSFYYPITYSLQT